MTCQEIQKLIDAHHDGELDAANTLKLDDHLADCPGCFATLRQLSVLRGALRNENLRFSGPPDLRQSVRAAIAQAASGERETPVAPDAASRPWFQYLGWIAAAATIAVSTAVFEHRPGGESDRLIGELASSHVRSLMATHLMDVASSDQHTVKPWFDGKLDFAPPVRDLRESGFPLLGGRLDFVDGRPAAALIYGRQKHYLNLFIWPAKTATPQNVQGSQRNGYNVLQWSDGKMNFSVVSDLNEADLRLFVTDWTGQ